MAVTEKVYPDWVQAYRSRGTTIKKKGDSYYLYKRTSRRVPGKKWPQPVDTYIGVITPDGIVEAGKVQVPKGDIEVAEFGFSKTVLSICTDGWKKSAGKNWEDILKIIIVKWSPESYLREEVKPEENFRCSYAALSSSFSRRIHKEYGLSIPGDIEALKRIYIVSFEGRKFISNIHEEQKVLLDRLSVSLEVY